MQIKGGGNVQKLVKEHVIELEPDFSNGNPKSWAMVSRQTPTFYVCSVAKRKKNHAMRYHQSINQVQLYY